MKGDELRQDASAINQDMGGDLHPVQIREAGMGLAVKLTLKERLGVARAKGALGEGNGVHHE
jgi:hypothetical protein